MPTKLKFRYLLATTCLIIFSLFISTCFAGQVVTEQIRSWAKDAIKREKGLASITENNTLAVLYFENRTKRPELSPIEKGLAVMLITDLSKIKGLQVLERIRLQALLDELKLAVSGLVEKGEASRIGRLMGARYIVGGEITPFMKKGINIKAGIFDVMDESPLAAPTASGQLRELFKLEKEILLKITEALKIEIEKPIKAELLKPFSQSFDAAWWFFIGIDKSDREQYEEAARCYEKALEKDPNLLPARRALKELYDLGLIVSNKRRRFLKGIRDRTSLTDKLQPNYPTKRAMKPGEVQQRDSNDNNDNNDNNGNYGAGYPYYP